MTKPLSEAALSFLVNDFDPDGWNHPPIQDTFHGIYGQPRSAIVNELRRHRLISEERRRVDGLYSVKISSAGIDVAWAHSKHRIAFDARAA